MQNQVRWGILSTAKIAREKVIPAMRKTDICYVAAIASRDLERAQGTARDLGIPNAYGRYEDLLADPSIDAIYNPLPNHLHVPWTRHALAAGKHVLCEKPIGLDAAEAEALLETAKQYPDLGVMEGFMYRFHPQWIKAKSLVEDGVIGPLRAIHCAFSYFKDDPNDIRNQPDIGGGGLMDIGCYPVSLSRFLFDSEPLGVQSTIENDAEMGIDRLTSVVLEFNRGTSIFTVSTQLYPYQRVHIFGAKGRIEIEIPFNAPPDKPTRLWLETADGLQEITFDICDQYALQAEAFSEAILRDKPVPTPLEDAVANMRVLDQIREKAVLMRGIQ